MLQRSQTLYLLGVYIINILLLTGSLAVFTFEGGELVLKHSGVYDMEGAKIDLATWPLTVYFVFMSLLALVNIFSFKNRIRQMRISVFMMMLEAGIIGLVFYYIFYVRTLFEGLLTVHQWRIIMPPVAIILLYLAFRRIRRDELLVKAYDRIR